MRNLWILPLLFINFACVNVAKDEQTQNAFSAVRVETIYEDNISIRALMVNADHIFFAGNHGKFGYLNTADHSVAYLGKITENGKKPEFRAIGTNGKADFLLSVANPALLYKVNYFGKRQLVYTEENKNVFYDAMQFWNANEGIAIGDPVGDCMSVLITRDGGQTWQKVACDNLPPKKEGEAAFAASNSNIVVVGEKTWFVSGGKTSRVYFSPDKGKNWKVYNTPLVQGKSTTGAYSLDFYDEKNGVIFGGDYTKPEMKTNNKAISKDGGKTWQIVANGEMPGYRSCVKFIPQSNGKELVAIGFKGIAYSNDFGQTWQSLTKEPFYTLTFMNDFIAYAAGDGRIAKLTFIENGLKN